MNRFKNLLLITIALSSVALAIGQYHNGRAIAQSVQSVNVINKRPHAVHVVQTTQWEYKTAFCVGPRPNCYADFAADGVQGWELVAVIPAEANPGAHLTWDFVFKKPRL